MRKTTKWVVADANQEDVFWPSEAMKQHAWLSDASTYEQADKDPVAFWEERAREGLHWFKEWDTAYKQEPPYFQWFVGGKPNASYTASIGMSRGAATRQP